MNKRILSLLLCAVMLLHFAPHFSFAAMAAEESAEKVILDYNCDSLKDSCVSLRGNKYPNYFILDAATDTDEKVEEGTLYMVCDEAGGGDTSLVFNLPEMSKQTFSMKLNMKVHDLITPSANNLRRGFMIDMQVPGSRNIHIAFNTMTEPDKDGKNAVAVLKWAYNDTQIKTEKISIPTDDAFHEWELLFNGTDELRLLIDGVLQAVFTEIELNAVTTTGFLRVGISNQNIASGKNAITLDHISLTEGITFSNTQILLATTSRDSSMKAMTVETVLNELSENTELTVKVINEADRTQIAEKSYTPDAARSSVTLEDIPFSGVCEVVVSATGAQNYSFASYLYTDYEIITADASLTDEEAGKAYYFGDMYKIELPAKTKWKLSYTLDEDGVYGSLLTCQNVGDVHKFNVPVKLNGKFAVYVGYQQGTTRFAVNGTEVFVSYKKDGGDFVYERFATAGDFEDEEITVSNIGGNSARIAYVKFVPLSDELYEKFLEEDDSYNLMMDNDGYSIFCSSGMGSMGAVINRALTQYAEKMDLRQLNWCTFSTSILNYDSEVWWKYVTDRLNELGIPKDQWPENFLDHVDKEGVSLDFEHLMRDIDKTAFKNMLSVNQEGYPHEILADYAKENDLGKVYVSLRMSHYNSRTGSWAFQCGTLYYLYPEFIRGGSTYSQELSYSYETYRNYLHDLLLEMAAPENVAGITMDFGRYPYTFGSELLDVEERTEIMDAFIKSVHDDLPEGKELIVRLLHPTTDNGENYGLNFRHWVEGDYVDRVMINQAGHETFFDFTEYVEYFNEHDNVDFYLGMISSLSGHDMTKEEEDLKKQGIKIESGERVATVDFLLRAYKAYMAGADGFFLFNGINTSAVGGIDPAYGNLNNKTRMEQWYIFSYPAYLQVNTIETVAEKNVPADHKAAAAATTEVTTAAPMETTSAQNTTAALLETTAAEATVSAETSADSAAPLYMGIGAAIVAATAASVLILKNSKR